MNAWIVWSIWLGLKSQNIWLLQSLQAQLTNDGSLSEGSVCSDVGSTGRIRLVDSTHSDALHSCRIGTAKFYGKEFCYWFCGAVREEHYCVKVLLLLLLHLLFLCIIIVIILFSESSSVGRSQCDYSTAVSVCVDFFSSASTTSTSGEDTDRAPRQFWTMWVDMTIYI